MDSWFFENSGFIKIKELNDVYKEKSLLFANTQLSKDYDQYSPWMSNVEHLKSLECQFSRKELILNSREANHRLEEAYLNEEIENKLSLGNVSSKKLEIIEIAASMICRSSGDIAKLFSNVILHIIPINTDAGKFQIIGNGFSSHLAKGAIFLSVPKMKNDNELQLAINMVHELGHQCLYIYQTADPIIADELDKPIYSFVRKAMRPAIQSFHASVALAFMTKFLDEIKNQDVASSSYFTKTKEKLQSEFIRSLSSFSEVKFTKIGQLLFDELRSYAQKI